MTGRSRPTRPLVGLLLLAGAIASPVAADETGTTRVRLTTDRLDLVFKLVGASPVAWRACHPSCALADRAPGTSVRFRGSPAPALHGRRHRGGARPARHVGIRPEKARPRPTAAQS